MIECKEDGVVKCKKNTDPCNGQCPEGYFPCGDQCKEVKDEDIYWHCEYLNLCIPNYIQCNGKCRNEEEYVKCGVLECKPKSLAHEWRNCYGDCNKRYHCYDIYITVQTQHSCQFH